MFDLPGQERTALELGGVLVAVLAVITAGTGGLVGALGLVVAWYALPRLYAVALAHVLLVAFAPPLGLVRLVVLEAGLVIVLLAPAIQTGAVRAPARSILVAGLVVGGAVAGGILWASALWGGVLVLLITVACCAYGIHRYELVTLGLVEGSTDV